MEIPFPSANCDDEGADHPFEAQRHELERLPPGDPAEALLECFAEALQKLTLEDIELLRAEIAAESGDADLFVEIIDGHLVLRELEV